MTVDIHLALDDSLKNKTFTSNNVIFCWLIDLSL